MKNWLLNQLTQFVWLECGVCFVTKCYRLSESLLYCSFNIIGGWKVGGQKTHPPPPSAKFIIADIVYWTVNWFLSANSNDILHLDTKNVNRFVCTMCILKLIAFQRVLDLCPSNGYSSEIGETRHINHISKHIWLLQRIQTAGAMKAESENEILVRRTWRSTQLSI